MMTMTMKETRLVACQCAEQVAHIVTDAMPEETRHLEAIEIARQYALGQATSAEMLKARAACLALEHELGAVFLTDLAIGVGRHDWRERANMPVIWAADAAARAAALNPEGADRVAANARHAEIAA